MGDTIEHRTQEALNSNVDPYCFQKERKEGRNGKRERKERKKSTFEETSVVFFSDHVDGPQISVKRFFF